MLLTSKLLTKVSVAIFLTSCCGGCVLKLDNNSYFSDNLHFLSFIPFRCLIVCPNAIVNPKPLTSIVIAVTDITVAL